MTKIQIMTALDTNCLAISDGRLSAALRNCLQVSTAGMLTFHIDLIDFQTIPPPLLRKPPSTEIHIYQKC